MTLNYLKALTQVMIIEGGGRPHDVAGDPGGRTAWGISERWWPEYWEAGPPDLPTAVDFYYEHFWQPLRLSELPYHAMQYELFEAAVNVGPTGSVRFAQKAYNDIKRHFRYTGGSSLSVDGRLGDATVGALRSLPTKYLDVFVKYFNRHQLAYYDSLSDSEKARFLRGWIKRV